MGSLALPNINDLKILENSNQQRLIMIVSEPHERISDNILCTYITPYYISKLLRCEGILEGPLGVPFSSSMSHDLSMFLNLIYHPIHRSKCTPVHSDPTNKVTSLRRTSLWGKIFAISGFNEISPCNVVPCKYDITAGVRILGGHTESCMVEGLTTHLICETMTGDKYKVAKKWGPSKIKIVHWKWLLECLSKWTITETFDDDRNIFAAESDNLTENSVKTLEIMKLIEEENKIETKHECENKNKNEIDQENNNQNNKYPIIDEIKILKEKDGGEDYEEWRLKAKLVGNKLNGENFNYSDSLEGRAPKRFDKNESGDKKKSGNFPYFSVSDFNFYLSQTSLATKTGKFLMSVECS